MKANTKLAVAYINELCGREVVSPRSVLWSEPHFIRFNSTSVTKASSPAHFEDLCKEISHRLGKASFRSHDSGSSVREWQLSKERMVSIVRDAHYVSIGLIDRGMK